MRTLLAPLLLLLAAATAFAESADLSIRTNATPLDRPGRNGYLSINVTNAGPDITRNVAVSVNFNGQPLPPQPFASQHCDGERCTLGDIKTGSTASVSVQAPLPNAEGKVTWTVAATSDTPDPNPRDNSAATTVELKGTPWVGVIGSVPPWIDPRMPFTATLGAFNVDSFADAHDVVVTLDLPDGVGAKSLPSNCTILGNRLSCAFGDVLGHDNKRLELTLIAPARTGGERFRFLATVQLREPNYIDTPWVTLTELSRGFTVTTTADDGAGSLRAAIDAANAGCMTNFCAILFNIAEPSARPWKTIRVASPLPVLRVQRLHVDGATQTAFDGVVNPDGPPIEISGGGTLDGDGLVLGDGSCTVTLRNLAVNGFRRFGILTDHPTAVCTEGSKITDNFIGTDPTGAAAVPNGRGIATVGKQALTIQSNTISGNVRSGIFAFGGELRIIDNRIGLAAHADTPLPNGASGIYISPEAGGRTLIDRNLVAFNGEMGLAIDRAVSYAGGLDNRIWRNGGLAIDIGLDGFSPPNIPTITSAVFDPVTGETTIRGTAAPGHRQFFTTEIFASDAPGPGGAGDAQRRIGSDPREAFELKVKGDLRGQWIAAATTSLEWGLSDFEPPRRTTELSPAVQVR